MIQLRSVLLLLSVCCILCLSCKGDSKINSAQLTPTTTRQKQGSDMPSRSIEQLQLNRDLLKNKVFELWGDPDRIVGNGVEQYVYSLSKDICIGMQFSSDPPHRLVYAVVTNSNDKSAKVLFQDNNK